MHSRPYSPNAFVRDQQIQRGALTAHLLVVQLLGSGATLRGTAAVEYQPPFDREQPGSQRTFSAKAVHRRECANKRVLHQLLDLLLLARAHRKPGKRVGMPCHDICRCPLIASPPRLDEFLVGHSVAVLDEEMGDPLRVDYATSGANIASMHPEIISHRGLAVNVPENTLGAFEAAIGVGAHAVELDVHGTADGEIVVHHDFTLAAAGGRSIASLEYGEVESVDLGSGHRIPTLIEVLERLSGRATVYVEVKATGIELAVARVLRNTGCSVAVHSFDHRISRDIAAMVPGLPAGILMVARPIDPLAALDAAAARDLWQHVDFIDQDLVDTVHATGRRVIAWTANGPGTMRRLSAMGVDGLCTDNPPHG